MATTPKKATRKAAKKAVKKRAKIGRTGLRETKRKAVLRSLSLGACITTACREANLPKSTFYDWVNDDPAWAAAVEAAQAKAIRSVEQAMFRRAKSMSAPGGATAGIFLLKNKLPEEYRDVRQLNLGGQVAVDRVDVLKQLVDAGEPGSDGSSQPTDP